MTVPSRPQRRRAGRAALALWVSIMVLVARPLTVQPESETHWQARAPRIIANLNLNHDNDAAWPRPPQTTVTSMIGLPRQLV